MRYETDSSAAYPTDDKGAHESPRRGSPSGSPGLEGKRLSWIPATPGAANRQRTLRPAGDVRRCDRRVFETLEDWFFGPCRTAAFPSPQTNLPQFRQRLGLQRSMGSQWGLLLTHLHHLMSQGQTPNLYWPLISNILWVINKSTQVVPLFSYHRFCRTCDILSKIQAILLLIYTQNIVADLQIIDSGKRCVFIAVVYNSKPPQIFHTVKPYLHFRSEF